MSRLNKLETYYKEQLKNHNINDVSIFIQSVIDADITKGKYARFLIEAFLNDKFLEEDLVGGLDSTVGQAISLFDKHKSKLPENMRSVYAFNQETGKALYQSPGDLWNSVKQYQGELSGKELKKEEQEKIYRETEFVYKDEKTGFQIISPLTEESAKWWGKGTRWCTSAEKNNRFERYTKQAPLFILLMPDNHNKLQLWKNNNDTQFMDKSDNNVDLNYIEQNWDILEPICLWLNDLKFIPKSKQVYEDCLTIIKNGTAINISKYIHDKLISKEMCELAIQSDPMNIKFIPKEYITKKLCQMAIEKDSKTINFIPNEMVDSHLFYIAAKTHGNILLYTPEKFRTKEFCLFALKNNNLFYNIPKKYITYELCKLAVSNNPKSFPEIPDEYKTKELCKIAVKKNGTSLGYISEKLKTYELCKIAVQSNQNAIEYIPRHFFSEELFKIAISKYPSSLKLMPMNYFDYNTCEYKNLHSLIVTFLKEKKISLSNIFSTHINEEIVLLAIKNKDSLLYVPEQYKTKEICDLAIKNDIQNIQFIPKEYRNIKDINDFVLFLKNKYKIFFDEILDSYDIYTENKVII